MTLVRTRTWRVSSVADVCWCCSKGVVAGNRQTIINRMSSASARCLQSHCQPRRCHPKPHIALVAVVDCVFTNRIDWINYCYLHSIYINIVCCNASDDEDTIRLRLLEDSSTITLHTHSLSLSSLLSVVFYFIHNLIESSAHTLAPTTCYSLHVRHTSASVC